ncbi:MAG: biotin/lipoyl-containing protein [Cyclobacteriaceae bacterium]|nr:biotin/lipoyl-containing protein [Cyclobacteriaceae bacterium]
MYTATINENNKFSIQLKDQVVFVNDLQHKPEITKVNESEFLVIMNKKPYYVSIIKRGKDSRSFQMLVNNRPVSVQIHHQSEAATSESSLSSAKRFIEYLKAPMPGLIADVLVRDGEAVIDGQPLLILKAMKMENILRAPHDGTIRRVLVAYGQKINKDEPLIQF